KCGGPEYIIKDKKLGHLLKNTNDVEYLSSEIDNLLQNKAYDKEQIYRMSYARQEYGFERFLELFNDLVLKKYENK
ncbi:glycosyltransferase family 4 protein, partial [Escherichia coli]|nr:glycosyltransferase family 4 protein [Escherichia coli]